MTRSERTRSFLIDDDENDDIGFKDLTVWANAQTKTCIRICEAVTTSSIWDGYSSAGSASGDDSNGNKGKTESRLTIFLSFALMDNGMYERDGLVMQQEHLLGFLAKCGKAILDGIPEDELLTDTYPV